MTADIAEQVRHLESAYSGGLDKIRSLRAELSRTEAARQQWAARAQRAEDDSFQWQQRALMAEAQQ